jgi:hypothetical protein
MYDTVRVFRSRIIERVRALIASHYCFSDPKNHSTQVAALVEKDNFAVKEVVIGSKVRLYTSRYGIDLQ